MDVDSDAATTDDELFELLDISSADNEADDSVTGDQFNIELAAEHSYLGDLQRVPGVTYLEPNKSYKMPIIYHAPLVFPGETIPMILPHNIFPMDELNGDGLIFGLVSREIRDESNSNSYGVTCQVYEKSSLSHNVTLKTRACQRFVIPNKLIDAEQRTWQPRVAFVTILPEIELPHPIYGGDSDSLSKFRLNESMKSKLLRFQSQSQQWPTFVYQQYNASFAVDKIIQFLNKLKIETVKMDLVSLSFWFAQNAILDPQCRRKVFLTNNVLERILLICQSLEDKYIVCKRCHTKIANVDKLFAMSKEGFRTNFCNPGGSVHETHTITDTIPEVVLVSGTPSSEFSWFPGYSWRYVHCALCSSHLGWKYYSQNLRPKTFVGLTGMSILFENLSTTQNLPPLDLSDDGSGESFLNFSD